VNDGIVYVGSNDHSLYALNAMTGALLWTYATGWHVESSPAVVNGVLYFGSSDYTLYALGARTGALLWSYVTGRSYYGIVSSPAVLNGTLYVGSGDGNLYRFSRADDLMGWSTLGNRPELSTLHPDPKLQPSEKRGQISR
jgi:outer membrane protein assembly factor BamB